MGGKGKGKGGGMKERERGKRGKKRSIPSPVLRCKPSASSPIVDDMRVQLLLLLLLRMSGLPSWAGLCGGGVSIYLVR